MTWWCDAAGHEVNDNVTTLKLRFNVVESLKNVRFY